MVAEEDSADLTAPSGAGMLTRITQLINSVLGSEVEGSPQLTEQQVVELIGEYHSSCMKLCTQTLTDCRSSTIPSCHTVRRAHPDGSAWSWVSSMWVPCRCWWPLPVAVCLQTLARVQVVRRGATGCWTPLTARAALWACGSMQCAWACCRMARWCLACWAAPTCHSLQWLMTTEVQVSLAAGRALGVCWP